MNTTQYAITEQAVQEALLDVMDPEIPNLSIVDLGIVRRVSVGGVSGDAIEVELLPTFVGCPALDIMKESVMERLHSLSPNSIVTVKISYDEPWTTDRISDRGREVLKTSGFAPPSKLTPVGGKLNMIQLMPVAECPYCGSRKTVMDNAFGPTLCRAIYYCTGCRQPFEQFKQV